MQEYLYLPELVCLINEPNRTICTRILEENLELFKTAQGSSHNHQNWRGGYFDHIREVMNIALVLYKKMNSLRDLPFSLSDALLIIFLHDIEKPWKYEIGPDGELRHKEALRTEEATHEFRDRKLKQYGIVLTSEQDNAMKYIHGELNEYTPRKRVVGPLGTFCHICDVFSARIWFDYPKEGYEDSWWPAQRVNSKI